jgi:hypothetical protein
MKISVLTIFIVFLMWACEETMIVTCYPDEQETEANAQPLVAGPQLVSPADGAIMDNGCREQDDLITWEFEWEEFEEDALYHLYVKGSNAIYPLIDMQTYELSYTNSVIGYIIPQNQFNWKWQVRVQLKNGEWTAWSSRTFDAEDIDTDCKDGDQ